MIDPILVHLTDADRDFVSLFLNVDIQRALAEAHTNSAEAGLAIVDGLLQRFAGCDHPLTLGLLHEARARILFAAGRVADYEKDLAETERWFRGTGTPILIARCEALTAPRTSTAPADSRPSNTYPALLDDSVEASEVTKVLAE
jgi:hypothetical protein